MGINCVLSQARYWLISLGTAFLVSSNSLTGDLHLSGLKAAQEDLLGVRSTHSDSSWDDGLWTPRG